MFVKWSLREKLQWELKMENSRRFAETKMEKMRK